MIDGLTDGDILARIQDDAERQQRQLSEDLRALLSVDWGRRLALWLIYDLGSLMGVAMRAAPLGHAVASIKDGETADRHAAFFDGRRDMALDIYTKLAEADAGGMLEAQAEHMRATVAAIARRSSFAAKEPHTE